MCWRKCSASLKWKKPHFVTHTQKVHAKVDNRACKDVLSVCRSVVTVTDRLFTSIMSYYSTLHITVRDHVVLCWVTVTEKQRDDLIWLKNDSSLESSLKVQRVRISPLVRLSVKQCNLFKFCIVYILYLIKITSHIKEAKLLQSANKRSLAWCRVIWSNRIIYNNSPKWNFNVI